MASAVSARSIRSVVSASYTAQLKQSKNERVFARLPVSLQTFLRAQEPPLRPTSAAVVQDFHSDAHGLPLASRALTFQPVYELFLRVFDLFVARVLERQFPARSISTNFLSWSNLADRKHLCNLSNLGLLTAYSELRYDTVERMLLFIFGALECNAVKLAAP